MKFTCLSKGTGFHFPPCHILNICGVRILLDCPLDLSALSVFAPVPADFCPMLDISKISDLSSANSMDENSRNLKRPRVEEPLDVKHLICAEPWYKTVNNLHLWNPSFIDIILISSPTAMLALPFLTRDRCFSAKVYITEAAARLGRLMMEDLVSMHMEFKYFYGPEGADCPQWMKQGELEMLPSALMEKTIGKDRTELGGWMPLYSAADVKDCLQKVQTLKYSEEACYNGTLVLKPFSSGSDIGACNWVINGPKGSVACVSNSIFVSNPAMDFNYHDLQGNDLIIYSDFSYQDANKGLPLDNGLLDTCSADKDNGKELYKSLLGTDEVIEEREKLEFICSCIVDSVKAGGSVLIPISRLGLVLQLLEDIAVLLETSNLMVPIYFISSVAEELLAYTNIIPEWLCKQRQEKLFSGKALFSHFELMKEKKLLVFPAIHSPNLLKNWKEPCIVFSPHWSLRLGPSVHLLRRWCKDPSSLLVLEEFVDADLALLPFQPVAMKVLQCSFLSGIKLPKVKPLLNLLQPKVVLFPEALRNTGFEDSSSFSVIGYSDGETLRVARFKDNLELEIATDLVSKLQWKNLKKENIMSLARLKGELVMHCGKYRLLSGMEPMGSSKCTPLLHWGSPDVEKLMVVLSEMGISCSREGATSISADSVERSLVNVVSPGRALIDIRAKCTRITADENLVSIIRDAIDRVVDGI